VLAKENRLDQAAAHYKRLLVLNPDLAEAHNSLGIVLADQGKSTKAMACFERALALKPDYAEAYYNQGLVMKKESRLEEAVTRYDRALAIKADYAEALNNRGNALRSLNRPAEALASYDGALAVNPKDPETWNNRGIIFIDLARYAEVTDDFDKAIALRADFASLFCATTKPVRPVTKRWESIFPRTCSRSPGNVKSTTSSSAARSRSSRRTPKPSILRSLPMYSSTSATCQRCFMMFALHSVKEVFLAFRSRQATTRTSC
jgi:tetratricopeptide (TPR) repeat protein